MPPPGSKKELQSFLGILNYSSMFSSVTAEVCKHMLKLTSVKADLTWNKMYQDLYNTAKKVVKKDACMKFYDASRPVHIYMETDW